MSTDLDQAREAIARCRSLRQSGVVEAVLRGEFQSRLRRIFPDAGDEGWINHYGEGAEAHTKVGTKTGKVADRFIDNLVGSTTIEYETDLRIAAKRDEGYHQVREHAAGLIRAGSKDSQVRGILSDTVEWHAYDVALRPGADPATCTSDDVDLTEVESFTEGSDDDQAAERLTLFLRRHLAREQSRPLIADNLAFDLGLESPAYRRNVDALTALVEAGRKSDPSIALATDLWSHFVDHLEGSGGPFRTGPYVDEIYLNILGRLLSANALAAFAIVSTDDELHAILNGEYFRNHYQLDNLVEQDYFGWIANPTHIGGFLPVAREIQRDLYAYDFSRRAEEDLFGRLMAQLARRSQRKLLGQEWTPGWLARHLADRCLDLLPAGEAPAIVDMCCGSGSILAEVIKASRDRYGYLSSARPVAFSVSEVWQVVPGTFKYPGAALIGHKESDPADAVSPVQHGYVARPDGAEEVDFSIRKIGDTRTAWVLEKAGMPAAPAGSEEVSQQGADIMPRGAVCIEILNDSGSEHRVNTPTRDTTWGFTVKQVKELAGERFPGNIAPRFIHRMAQSENLLPFVLGEDRAPVAIPASRDAAGTWQIYAPADIRHMGFTRTARRFTAINKRLETVGAGNTLEYRINVRNKLTNQQFGNSGCLVLSGAGGKHICAACVPLTEANDLVIDQTLYWQVVANENEAWFRTGVLNSGALTEAILPFNPEGDFGPRHIHTLPYRLMPAFDPTNEDHQRIGELARQLTAIVVAAVAGDEYLGDPNRALTRRRSKLREALAGTGEKKELEELCAALLGTSAPEDETGSTGTEDA